jgi:hypothetical protein
VNAVKAQIQDNKAKIVLIDQALLNLKNNFQKIFPKIEDPGEIEYQDFDDQDVDESYFPPDVADGEME